MTTLVNAVTKLWVTVAKHPKWVPVAITTVLLAAALVVYCVKH